MEAMFRLSPVADDTSLVHNAFMKHARHDLEHSEPASILYEQMIGLNPGSATEGYSSVISAMPLAWALRTTRFVSTCLCS